MVPVKRGLRKSRGEIPSGGFRALEPSQSFPHAQADAPLLDGASSKGQAYGSCFSQQASRWVFFELPLNPTKGALESDTRLTSRVRHWVTYFLTVAGGHRRQTGPVSQQYIERADMVRMICLDNLSNKSGKRVGTCWLCQMLVFLLDPLEQPERVPAFKQAGQSQVYWER